MGEYNIEIGATDGFRYIGIEPPLEREQHKQILERLESEIEFDTIENGRALSLNSPFKGPAHSELGLIHTLDDLSDQRVRDVAGKIRSILEDSGHSTMFDPELKYIGFGRHLFGGEDRVLGG